MSNPMSNLNVTPERIAATVTTPQRRELGNMIAPYWQHSLASHVWRVPAESVEGANSNATSPTAPAVFRPNSITELCSTCGRDVTSHDRHPTNPTLLVCRKSPPASEYPKWWKADSFYSIAKYFVQDQSDGPVFMVDKDGTRYGQWNTAHDKAGLIPSTQAECEALIVKPVAGATPAEPSPASEWPKWWKCVGRLWLPNDIAFVQRTENVRSGEWLHADGHFEPAPGQNAAFMMDNQRGYEVELSTESACLALVNPVAGATTAEPQMPTKDRSKWRAEGSVLFGPNDDETGIAFDDPSDAMFIASAAKKSNGVSLKLSHNARCDTCGELYGEVHPDGDRWHCLNPSCQRFGDAHWYSSVSYRSSVSVGEPLTLAMLREANRTRSARWSNGKDVPLDFAMMELAGETGEACNAAKKMARLRYGMKGGSDQSANLAEELADVVICADLAAMKAGVNLADAVAAKFNRNSEQHGFPERLPSVSVGEAETSGTTGHSDEDPQPDTCHECGELAVGYDEGVPKCAVCYRGRKRPPSGTTQAASPSPVERMENKAVATPKTECRRHRNLSFSEATQGFDFRPESPCTCGVLASPLPVEKWPEELQAVKEYADGTELSVISSAACEEIGRLLSLAAQRFADLSERVAMQRKSIEELELTRKEALIALHGGEA